MTGTTPTDDRRRTDRETTPESDDEGSGSNALACADEPSSGPKRTGTEPSSGAKRSETDTGACAAPVATDGGVAVPRTESAAEESDDRDRSGNADVDGTSDSLVGEGPTFAGEDLVVGYPAADEPVIDGETIRVPAGKVTALVGPNGSGKSTLLKCLADQLSPDAGTVRVDGRAIHELESKELARELGLLSQENVAPDSITVEDLVAHGRYPHRSFFEPLDDGDRAAIERAIEMAGVGHLRDREVGSLSGGQKQLAWIAMVLAQDTDVLLLDEPTTFLDLHHQLQVMEVVETLRSESPVTVVVVLHDLDQAATFADHLVALQDGAVYDHGAPSEVVTEELLATVFGVEATVTETDVGPRVTPRRPIDDRPTDD